MIYGYYFASIEEVVTLNIESSGTLLPCPLEENFQRICARAVQFSLPFHRIAKNLAISLLLTNHQVSSEAMPLLYQSVHFKCPSIDSLKHLPSVMKTNMQHISVEASAELSDVIGHVDCLDVDYEFTDWVFVPTDADQARHIEAARLWKSAVSGNEFTQLQTLTLCADREIQMMLAIRHFLKNGQWGGGKRSIYVDTVVDERTERRDRRKGYPKWEWVASEIEDAEFVSSVSDDACIMPAAAQFMFSCNEPLRLSVLEHDYALSDIEVTPLEDTLLGDRMRLRSYVVELVEGDDD